MVTKEGEVIAEVGKVEELAKPAQEVPAPEVEQAKLSSELEKIQKELTEAREEAKAHQRNVTKKEQELQQYKKSDEKISGLEDKIEIITQMIADVMDKDSSLEDEEKPRKRRSEEYLAKIAEKDTERKKQVKQATDQEFYGIMSEADKLIKSVNLDMEKSLELREAYIKFLTGDIRGCAEEARRVVNTLTEAKKVPQVIESEAEKEAKLRDKITKEIYEAKGWNISDTGSPAGAGGKGIPREMTRFKEWLATVPTSEYVKLKPEIDNMLAKGLIK